MKRALCVFVIVMAAFFYGSGIAGAGAEPSLAYTPYNMWFGLPVFVTNSDSSPIPVKGDLGITGIADVNITNTEINPVPVRNPNEPGRVPYEVTVRIAMTGFDRCRILQETGSSYTCPNTFFNDLIILFDLPEVPIEKRLIMKRFSGAMPAGSSIGAYIAFQWEQVLGPESLKYFFPGPFFPIEDGVYGFDSGDLFVTYGPVEAPHVNIKIPSSSNFICEIAFSGYLIDAD